MTEINNQRPSITFEELLQIVTLAPNQYDPEAIGLIEQSVQGNVAYLHGTALVQSSGELRVSYELPEGFKPLTTATKKMTLAQRLGLSLRLLRLADERESQQRPLLDPDNIFVNAEDFRVGHRGLAGLMAPAENDEVLFFKKLKALIVYALRPSLEFSALVEGQSATADKLSQTIADTKDVKELAEVLNKAYREANVGTIVVKKRQYGLFKWGALATTVIAAICGIALIISAGVNAPKQARVVSSLGAYAAGNYSDATGALRKDDPAKLKPETQYALAMSYVEQDNLSKKQKDAITRGLSPKTTTNTLLYWIRLGRGELNKALDLAKNVGDDQLILYAYSKLYDATDADTSLSGETKQSRLDGYQQQIDKYTKKIGADRK